MKKFTYRNENGILIPNLKAPENNLSIGKYGMMRKKYLKQNRRSLYSSMILKGTLMEHLYEVDTVARVQVEQIVQKLSKDNGVDEKLKLMKTIKAIIILTLISIFTTTTYAAEVPGGSAPCNATNEAILVVESYIRVMKF